MYRFFVFAGQGDSWAVVLDDFCSQHHAERWARACRQKFEAEGRDVFVLGFQGIGAPPTVDEVLELVRITEAAELN